MISETMPLASQFDTHDFAVMHEGRTLGVYVHRSAIGGGEWSYCVKRGEAGDGTKGRTLRAGFPSRLESLNWIRRHVAVTTAD